MSHIFEFAAHNAPLMIIQLYNNKQQNTFSKPTDAIIKMNVAFAILNLIDLILELLLIQMVSNDHEFSIISKRKIGIIEDTTETSSSSEDESDTGSKGSKVALKEILPLEKKYLEQQKPLTHKERLKL